eukprot:Nitzschia sp. Nitz4//scaffold133_size116822//104672//105409//NITZ4_003825-RA/size116822-processed-gene-0.130-mRNA-1//1//CDS//3329535450//4983//frame0
MVDTKTVDTTADHSASVVSDIEHGFSKHHDITHEEEVTLIQALTELKKSVSPEQPSAAPLGLFAFGLCTCILQLSHSKMIGSDADTMAGINGVVVGFGMFYGGVLQLIAGMHEGRRNSAFTYWAFMVYGCFWMSLSFVSVVQYWSPEPAGIDRDAIAAMLFLFGVTSAAFWVCTFKANLTVCVLFGLLTTTFFLLSFGESREDVEKVGGYFALATGGLAFWLGFVDLVNITYGPTIPVGKFSWSK